VSRVVFLLDEGAIWRSAKLILNLIFCNSCWDFIDYLLYCWLTREEFFRPNGSQYEHVVDRADDCGFSLLYFLYSFLLWVNEIGRAEEVENEKVPRHRFKFIHAHQRADMAKESERGLARSRVVEQANKVAHVLNDSHVEWRPARAIAELKHIQ
jgi:hypothetical protein